MFDGPQQLCHIYFRFHIVDQINKYPFNYANIQELIYYSFVSEFEYLRICDLHVSSDFYSDDINEKAFILPRLKHVDIQLSLEDDDVSFRPLLIIWSSTT